MRRLIHPSDQEFDGKPIAPSLHDAKRSTQTPPDHAPERIAEAIRHPPSRCRGLRQRDANCQPMIRATAPPLTFLNGPPREYVRPHHAPSMFLPIILPCDPREPNPPVDEPVGRTLDRSGVFYFIRAWRMAQASGRRSLASALDERLASLSSTSRRYDHGLRRWRVALAQTLRSTDAVFNPPSPPTCDQFDRPMASGRIARSASPLSMAKLASSMYRTSEGHWMRAS